MTGPKNEQAVIRIAKLLADHGYDVRAVKQELNGKVTVMVFPPDSEKDTRK